MATIRQVRGHLVMHVPSIFRYNSADISLTYLETAVPWAVFKTAGYEVSIATENGKVPECDKKMWEGVTQKLLVRRA
jgi:hypothetical protein